MLTDNRKFSIGGSVALYLKSNVNYMLRDDLKMDGSENIWVDTQDLIIVVIYNPLIGPNVNFLMNMSKFCIPFFCLSGNV